MKISCMLVTIVGISTVNGGKIIDSEQSRNAVITKFNNTEWTPDGYSFEYETSSGSSRKERGYLKTDSNGKQFLVTEGEYSYIGDDKKVYHVRYIADEKGYRPTQREMLKNPIITPAVRQLDEYDIFYFPDNYDTTQNPTKLAGSTTGLPKTTEEYPFITTIIPGEEVGDLLDNRGGLPPDLVGSLLGK